MKKKNELVYDSKVSDILKMDGVIENQQNEANNQINSIDEIISHKPIDTSWSHTIINSDSNSATLIGQLPGEGNRMHFHPDWNEWWYIIQGSWEWNIEGQKKIIKPGQIVFIEKNKKHKITAVGKEMAVRLAVSRYDVDHVYTDDDYKPDLKN
jgi:quercetin dioxygenase-like cupin family protein